MPRSEIPAPRRADPLEGWLARRRWWVLAAVIFLSLAVRAAFFVQWTRSPCADLVRWDQTDFHAFDRWADAIAEGDLLSRDPPYPLHGWHLEVARSVFRDHPELRAELAGPAGTGPEEDREAARRLWDRWCGGGRFYQDPLYPYLVAGVYALTGHHPEAVVLFQMGLGIWTNLLLLGLGRRLFSETAGAAAALLGVLSGPLLFYEGLLVRATAISFTGLAVAWLLVRALERRHRWTWAVAGLVIGLSLWLRASFVLVAVGAILLLVVRYRREPREVLGLGGAALLGMLVGFAPVVARNAAVGAPLLETASAGGVNFALGNSSESRVDNAFFSFRKVAPILYESDGRLLPAVRATLRTHGSRAGYARLLAAKLALAWKGVEVPNNASLPFCRLHVPVLRWLPVTFFWIGPLGLLGLVLAGRQARRAAPLYLVAATQLAVLVLFFVFSRYRAPLYAALLPFAGLTVSRAVAWARHRKWLPLAILVAAAAALVAWSSATPADLPDPVRVADHAVALQFHYAPRAEREEKAGRPERAAQVWEEAIRFEPEIVAEIGPERPPRDSREVGLVDLYNQARYQYARDLDRAARTEEAERQRALILSRVEGIRRYRGKEPTRFGPPGS